MDLKKDILSRVGIVYILILILAVSILGRTLYLQLAEGEYWKERASSISQKDIIIEPDRGDICAIDGRLLASSVPYYEIRMDMSTSVVPDEIFYAELDSLSYCLSQLFEDKTEKQWRKHLIDKRAHQSRYALIKRKASYIQLEKLKTFPIFRLGKYKGGLIVEQRFRRAKPFAKLASRTIGYLNEDGNGEKAGKVGLEQAYENELKGVKGVKLMQKISGGTWMPVKYSNEIEPKDGKDLITTIDINIQDVAENALMNQLVLQNAHHGTAILMEVETGYIKAIANLEVNKDGEYIERYNYAIGASTEPGSTFKLASLLAGFEDGKFDLNDSIDTKGGKVKFYDRIMQDSRPGGYGVISVKQAFAYSSNTAVSQLINNSYKSNPQQFIDRLYRMKLHKKLDLEIVGEGNPLIKDASDKTWSGTTLPWMSIGYEVKLTPLQILAFYNAIANDGKMVRPMLAHTLMTHGKVEKRFPSTVISSSICSKETIQKAKEMLEAVVEEGTGKNMKAAHYKIAGKTGTAQIANDKYGYKTNAKVSYQASFVGYFPADNPKYSCIVVVNAPSNGVYYGNLVAGSIFKEIADKVYATSLDLQEDVDSLFPVDSKEAPVTRNGNRTYLTSVLKDLNIQSRDKSFNADWVVTTCSDSVVTIENKIIHQNLVPDVHGMGASDAVYILENKGLIVTLIGKGSVKKQSISPGIEAVKGSRIIIELS